MPVIAITGGIGSGKSLTLSYFEQAACSVISMDDISRQLTEQGEAAYTDIVDAFGDAILNADKSLDRSALAQSVFGNSHKRQILEQILHPEIERRVRGIIAEIQQKNDSNNIILVEIPLLDERHQFDFIEHVLVVESSPALQLERVIARDSSRSSKDIQDIIGSQISDQQRRILADDILYNTGTMEQLKSKVLKLVRQYQLLP